MQGRVPPTVQNRKEPTLGELYSMAQNLYAKTGDERLQNAIQQVESKDGTMTDSDVGNDLNNIANEFNSGEIATTNMSDGAKHTEKEIIKQIKLNKKRKGRLWQSPKRTSCAGCSAEKCCGSININPVCG